MTVDELLAMPEDGMRRELVAGELREMTPVGRPHARTHQRINRSLDAHVLERGLGEVYSEYGYVLESEPATVRAPDLSFVRTDRLGESSDQGYFVGVPDLAIEIVSPNDRLSEVRAKVKEYLDAGTPMVIVADPQNRDVLVYRSGGAPLELSGTDIIDGGDVVPGWRLPVRDIFG
ncbi:MAG TPA: Uma2 family endonuclease [Longimicrobium sp.]|nr:Uma2 family endonuclease [Longimicrobium sp.]